MDGSVLAESSARCSLLQGAMRQEEAAFSRLQTKHPLFAARRRWFKVAISGQCSSERMSAVGMDCSRGLLR